MSRLEDPKVAAIPTSMSTKAFTVGLLEDHSDASALGTRDEDRTLDLSIVERRQRELPRMLVVPTCWRLFPSWGVVHAVSQTYPFLFYLKLRLHWMW
ncbi:hypothetical protein KCU95_g50, partial [Aureobasidium melanogenum]